MKRPVFHAFLILLTALLATACGKSEKIQNREGIRAVSLAPALTELAFHLGGGGSLCGRTDVCTYPAQAADLPVTGQFGNPGIEALLKQKPTHIFANALINPGQKKIFEDAGIKVFLHPCDTMEDYLFWVELMGKELDRTREAEQEKQRIENWLTQNASRPANGKRVIFILWDEPLMVAGSGTLPDTAVTLAGGINAAGAEKGYLKCSGEFLLKAKPDVLVWAVERPFSRASALLRSLQVPQVYEGFPLDPLLRPGPRFPAGVDALRSFLEGGGK